MDTSAFVDLTRRMEKSEGHFNYKDLKISVGSEGDIILNDRILSSRAISCLSRILRMPLSMFQIEPGLLTQILKARSVQMEVPDYNFYLNPTSGSETVLITPSTRGIFPVSDYVERMQDSTIQIMGDPVEDARLKIYTRSGSVDAGSQAHMVGVASALSYTPGIPFFLAHLLWTQVCSNGLMGWKEDQMVKISAKDVCPDLVFGAYNRLMESVGEYSQNVVDFVNKASELVISDPMETILQEVGALGVPKAVIHRAEQIVEEFPSQRGEYANQGLANIDTLWGVISLFTLASQRVNSVPSQMKADSKIHQWGETKLAQLAA